MPLKYFEKYLLTEVPTARILCFLGRAYDYSGDRDKAERVLHEAVGTLPLETLNLISILGEF